MRTLVRTQAFTTLREPHHHSDLLLGWMAQHEHAFRLPHPDYPHLALPAGVRTALAVPMHVAGPAGRRLVGLLALYNKRGPTGAAPPAFTAGDARLLGTLAAQSAQAVERERQAVARQLAERARLHAIAERQRVTRAFGEHTAPAVVEAILRGDATEGPGRRLPVCVMFLDLRGFTARAETRPPEETVAYLNAFFDLAIAAVLERGGVVHQLLGDGFMALWGAPVAAPDDPTRAVQAARAILAETASACAAGRLPPTRVGIGLHAGEAVAGMVGSAGHREYKVTGDVVNVAARVEKLNKRFDAQLLVTDAVWAGLPAAERGGAEPLGEVALDGRAGGVALYRLA